MSALPATGKGLEALARMLAAALAAEGARQATKAMPRDATNDCTDDADEPSCDQCGLGSGHMATEPRYIARSNRINYDYQLWIANKHAGPERFHYAAQGDPDMRPVSIDWAMAKDIFGKGGNLTTTEWKLNGVMFDGFWRKKCTVVEAKGNYDKFIIEELPWTRKIIDEWKSTAFRQQKAISPYAPSAKLEWHFMEPLSFRAAIENKIPPTIAHWTPMTRLA